MVIRLKLEKRECDIKVKVTPVGGDFQQIKFKIGEDFHEFWPSAIMNMQFSQLIAAIYYLYNDCHEVQVWYSDKRMFSHDYDSVSKRHILSSRVLWDEEGRFDDIRFTRKRKHYGLPITQEDDVIEIDIIYHGGKYHYEVFGRDLCYAISKAATEVLKKYGFYGYIASSTSQHGYGEEFSINELLFLKAHALGSMEVRKLVTAWRDPKGWKNAEVSSFEKEMELLMFDM